jgi:hypothetical protein
MVYRRDKKEKKPMQDSMMCYNRDADAMGRELRKRAGKASDSPIRGGFIMSRKW